jgi:hypothetical protein
MSKLEELIAELGNATGPSPKLDAEIRATLFAEEGAYAAKSPINGAWCVYKGVDRSGREKLHENRTVPHTLWIGEYTASLDAAVALVNRVLPGSAVMMGWAQSPSTKPWARVGAWTGPDATGANQAIALCVACLRAKLAQEEA